MSTFQFTSQFEEFQFKLSTVTETDFITEAKAVAALVFPEWDTDKQGDVGFFALRVYIKALVQGVNLANAWAQEFNIFLAREESSILAHARRLGFNPPSATPARVDVILDLPPPLPARTFDPFELQMSTRNTDGVANEIFFENEFAFAIGAGVPQVVVAMIAGKSFQQNVTADGTDFQTVILENPDVIDGSVRVEFLTIPWTEQEDLIDSLPTDLHFITRLNPDGTTEVSFGDGNTGARPPEGEVGTIDYRVGGGDLTNVPTDNLDFVTSSPLPEPSGTNPLKASGGTDRDSAEVIAKKATDNVRQRDSLVTLTEVNRFAENFSGVARAVSQLVENLVLVFIIPEGGGGATLTLKDALRQAIDEQLVMGFQSQVDDVLFTVPTISVEFTTKEGFVSAQVEDAVVVDLAALVNPLSTVVDPQTRRVSFRRDFGVNLFINEIRDVMNNRPEIEKDFVITLPIADIPVNPTSITTDIGATITATSLNERLVGFLTPG